MPKATLVFSLPDERDEYACAVNGVKYRAILQEVDNWLRNKVKHDSKLKAATRDAYADVRALIYDEAREEGVDIHD